MRLKALMATILLLGAGCGQDGDPDGSAALGPTSESEELVDADDLAGGDDDADGEDADGDDAASAAAGPADESGSRYSAEESQIRDVHTRFMTELFDVDERVEAPDAILPAAEELTTGNQLERIRQRVRYNTATGETLVGPGYDTNIVSVEIDGDHAVVVDCSLDPGEIYGADGAVLVPADDFYKLRSTELVLVDGTWLVENFLTGGDERCDPDE